MKVAETSRGDDTLALAEEDMISASVGYRVKKPSDVQLNKRTKMRRVMRAFIDHLAMVEAPAYEGARVLAVRAEPSGLQVAEPLPPTPALDEAMDDEILAWARARHRLTRSARLIVEGGRWPMHMRTTPCSGVSRRSCRSATRPLQGIISNAQDAERDLSDAEKETLAHLRGPDGSDQGPAHRTREHRRGRDRGRHSDAAARPGAHHRSPDRGHRDRVPLGRRVRADRLQVAPR